MTDLPWSYWPKSCGGVISQDSTATHVCSLTDTPDKESNAAFIVKACNSHDELIAALKDAEEFVNLHSESWHKSGQATLAHIQAALNKAQ